MIDAHQLLQALTIVLSVAAITTILFHKIHQPVILGYILAGLMIGPHVPFPLVVNADIVRLLSELGVILLMFSLGLEFRIKKLLQLGTAPIITALLECSVMIWLGFMAGQAFGWTVRESLFTGGMIAISSTTVIAKTFDEKKISGPLRELVIGILVIEDLIAVLLITFLITLSWGHGFSFIALGKSFGNLAIFLVALVVLGLFVIPRLIRMIVKLEKTETLLVSSIGFCFAVSFLAYHLGYSVALGAFLAGSIVSESGEGEKVEALILPVRDMFAALFFVSVGLLIDPAEILRNLTPILVMTVLVLLGKTIAVSTGAFLTGKDVRLSLQSGISLAQIGEFSFIIAGLGLSLQSTRPFLYPVAVAVSVLTSLVTPWLIHHSGRIASFVERKLPRRLQHFASFHGSWIENLRGSNFQDNRQSEAKRLIKLLSIDTFLLIGLLITLSAYTPRIEVFIQNKFQLSISLMKVFIAVGSILLASPFLLGILRISGKLSAILGEAAIPKTDEPKLDLALAPRKVFTAALRFLIVLLVTLLFLALTHSFLPHWPFAILLLLFLSVLGYVFWRHALNFEGHVRAGAEVIVEALKQQTAEAQPQEDTSLMNPFKNLLPGLGEPVSLRLNARSSAIGKSIVELDVRGSTGATILAIVRANNSVVFPSPKEKLKEGDLLALSGTRGAIEAAKELLSK